MNGLRSRVRLRTDGGLKTPEDVIVAALLGAEEFGFGTSILVAIGCDMARQCHLNTCPTGIATQKEELRAKYKGTPEMVIAFFTHLAEGIRENLAAMGARSIDDLVGRSDLLAQKPVEGRAALLDLSEIMAEPAAVDVRKKSINIDHNKPTLDDRLLELISPALDAGQSVETEATIATPDRTIGAKVANAIAVRRAAGKPVSGDVTCRFAGSAGQSFGAFIVAGMQLSLEGEANDYVGKGMSGGEIAIRPPRSASFTTPQVIAGNTNLYGATGGALFVAGKAGERFGVRNSGATAVVEGVGDHGCEYMTGGTVVVLGPTGRNFGAGMTNGVVYVLDTAGTFAGKVHDESVTLATIAPGEDAQLRELIERHYALTGSRQAEKLLATWNAALTSFWRVIPKESLTLAPAPAEDEEKVAD
jgi:glutamate synthase domain-containing protein 3